MLLNTQVQTQGTQTHRICTSLGDNASSIFNITALLCFFFFNIVSVEGGLRCHIYFPVTHFSHLGYRQGRRRRNVRNFTTAACEGSLRASGCLGGHRAHSRPCSSLSAPQQSGMSRFTPALPRTGVLNSGTGTASKQLTN